MTNPSLDTAACDCPTPAYHPEAKRVNLALQGGGAHGAFTWGVLDRFLDEERIIIEGISGTSAGAMNAALVAEGMVEGGPEHARGALARFWRAISDSNRHSPLRTPWWDRVRNQWSLANSPVYMWLDFLSRVASPYDLNPFDINPLRSIIQDEIHFDLIHQCRSIKLYISATNVRTGRVEVFRNRQINTEVLLASACLPFMYKATPIGDEYYWDGGYMGNPTLYPLFQCSTQDVVIVQVNPLCRQEVPKTARDIINRVNEISFNSSLIQELRAIEFVSGLLEEAPQLKEKYSQMHLHRIACDDTMQMLDVSSKFNTDWQFLTWLRDVGRQSADDWLRLNWDLLGTGSTLNPADLHLSRPKPVAV